MASQVKKKRKVVAVTPFASFMNIKAETPSNEDEQARRAEKEEKWAKKAETDPDREQMEDESDDDYATRMEEMDEEEEQARAEGEIKDDPEAEEQDEEKPKQRRFVHLNVLVVLRSWPLGLNLAISTRLLYWHLIQPYRLLRPFRP